MAFNILTKVFNTIEVGSGTVTIDLPDITTTTQVATLTNDTFPDGQEFINYSLTQHQTLNGYWNFIGISTAGTIVMVIHESELDIQTITTVTEGGTTTYDQGGYLSTEALYGWNSSALSNESFTDNGSVSFRVSAASVGVIIGLNETVSAPDNSTYTDINYAFFMENGAYKIIEDGVIVVTDSTAFLSTDIFTVQRREGFIRYLVNGLEVRSVVTSNTSDMSLDVSMYASGDSVYDGVVSNDEPIDIGEASTFSGSGDVSGDIPYSIDNDTYALPENMTGSSDIEYSLTGVFESQVFAATSDVSAIARLANHGEGVMAPMQSHGSDHNHASGIGSLQPLESSGGGGLITINVATSINVMARMESYATGITGGITVGADEQEMAPLDGLASDYQYAAGQGDLLPLIGRGESYPIIKDGNAKITTATSQGCGVLLSTGRHILTAAHVVDAIIDDLANVSIEFDVDQSVSVPVYGAVSALNHPEWLGTTELLNGYDLAIIELDSVVSALVRRHELYRDTDEVLQTFSKRSFSPVVNPNTGDVSLAGWADINNRYDAQADQLNDVFDGAITIGNQLVYDWDNGNAVNDAMGANYAIHDTGVTGEGFTSAGDSGSAAFIGGKIVGITSWHVTLGTPPDVLLGTNATYGEVAGDTRVSFFADWIEANSSGYTATAEIRFPTATIESLVTAGTLNGAEQLGGFTTEIEAYTGAYFETSNLSFELTANATNPVIARANSLRFPTASIESLVLTGTTAKATLNYALNKEIEAYTGAQAKSLGGFNTELTAAVIQGSTINASLKFPSISISASASDVSTGMANLRPPDIDMVWGRAELSGFKTKINAKSGVDCEVL